VPVQDVAAQSDFVADQGSDEETAQSRTGETPALLSDETARTATVERVPDRAAVNLDELFETEWRKNLLAAALER